MSKTFSAKSPTQIITAVTIAFMCLNTFLPLNFSSVEAEATEYPFKLKITLEKTAYKLGEPVNVTWTLTNISDENVTLYNSIDWVFDFIIRDKDFNHVFQWRCDYGVLMVVLPFPPIAPGGNMTFTENWRQTYDGSNTYPYYGLADENVPSGIYYVFGVFTCGTYGFEFETPAIRITIG